jgi:hypothetical protein
MVLQEIENYQAITEDDLTQICAACVATSIWLLKHDFKKRVATVVAGYISEHANNTEKISDIGEEFPEGIDSDFFMWLRGDNSQQPFQFQVADLPDWEMHTLEYIEDDVQSVIFFALRVDGSTWGFVEVWETRTPRTFSTEQIAAAQVSIQALELTLASLSGKQTS